MRIVFSSHALERLVERGIGKETAIHAFRSPDKIEISNQNRRRVLFKKVYYNESLKRDHLLMLICEKKDDDLEIITIIDTSKISKYL